MSDDQTADQDLVYSDVGAGGGIGTSAQITGDRRLVVTASDLLADGSTFDVDFVVTDEDGAHTDVTWTFPVDASVVIPNVPPLVTIHTSNRTVNGGEVVDLSATVSDPDGDHRIAVLGRRRNIRRRRNRGCAAGRHQPPLRMPCPTSSP